MSWSPDQERGSPGPGAVDGPNWRRFGTNVCRTEACAINVEECAALSADIPSLA